MSKLFLSQSLPPWLAKQLEAIPISIEPKNKKTPEAVFFVPFRVFVAMLFCGNAFQKIALAAGILITERPAKKNPRLSASIRG